VRRRRFIVIAAAAAGLALPRRGETPGPRLTVWRGSVLGADATLQISHPDPAVARRLIGESLAEVARLEAQLSLYRPDSALVRLNRDGRLDDAPADLVRVLAEADRFHALSGGAFDVTVQPLWDLYAGHFSRPDADPAGPPAAAVAAAVARVGQDRMRRAGGGIVLAPGMAVTLNGIAQGYVTDRVADLLRGHGLDALVDMGEIRALGLWQVGLEDPAAPGRAAETIALEDRAVATSGGYGTRFDAAGRFNHIFDPADGRASWRYGAVSVVAADATTADALATAFCLLAEPGIAALAQACGVRVHLARGDGTRAVLAG
jgi:thiamine biosynthesis lipoprotein